MNLPVPTAREVAEVKVLHQADFGVESSRQTIWDSFTEEERARIATFLLSFGVPVERQADYLADVQGMVEFALDAYFAEIRDSTISHQSCKNKPLSTHGSPQNVRSMKGVDCKVRSSVAAPTPRPAAIRS